jgi:hypothetical protein
MAVRTAVPCLPNPVYAAGLQFLQRTQPPKWDRTRARRQTIAAPGAVSPDEALSTEREAGD